MGVYKIKGSPYYWYDFSIRGNRFRDSTKTDDRNDALAIEAKVRSQIVMGQHYKQTKQLTLTEAFGKYWLERARFTNSKASTKSHIQHIMKHLGEQTPLHEIDQATLSSYVAKCRAETYQKIAPGSENKGKATITSNATINHSEDMLDMVQSEISVVDPKINSAVFDKCIEALGSHDDEMNRWFLDEGTMRHFVAAYVTHAFPKLDPVVVSLEKCEAAHEKASADCAMGLLVRGQDETKYIVKAVLDSLKEQGVEVTYVG